MPIHSRDKSLSLNFCFIIGYPPYDDKKITNLVQNYQNGHKWPISVKKWPKWIKNRQSLVKLWDFWPKMTKKGRFRKNVKNSPKVNLEYVARIHFYFCPNSLTGWRLLNPFGKWNRFWNNKNPICTVFHKQRKINKLKKQLFIGTNKKWKLMILDESENYLFVF